jgi:hypothetical protein
MTFQLITKQNLALCSTYADVVAALTALGKSCTQTVPLYKIGFEGNYSKVIAEFGWDDNLTVALRTVIPRGPVRWDLVTDGGYGIVLSVDGPTQVTLAAGYTLPVGFTANVWDKSAGAEILPGSVCTRSGAVVTMASTAGMVAGDLILATGRSEFTVGNSTRNIQLGVNSVGYFTGLGFWLVGRALVRFLGTYRKCRLQAGLVSYTPLSALDKRIMIGWADGVISGRAAGFARDAVGVPQVALEAPTAVITYAANPTLGVQSEVSLAWFAEVTVSLSQFWRGSGSLSTNSSTITAVVFSNALYAGAIAYLVADDGALFGGISAEVSHQIPADAYHSSYDNVIAYLNLKGNTYKQSCPLYKRGYEGNSAYIIGHWGWNSEAVPAIVPIGAIRFDLVTNGGRGVVDVVNNGTQFTVLPGHTLSASGILREWDTSLATELRDSAFTVSGNVVTVSDTTGLVPGDVAIQTVSSEFTIGGATRNLRLDANVQAYFTGTGLYVAGGRVIFTPLGLYRKARLSAGLISYTALGAREDRVVVGWSAAASLIAGGICRNDTDTRLFAAYSTVSGTVESLIGAGGGGSAVNGAQTSIGLEQDYEYSTGETHWNACCSSLAAVFTGQGAAIAAAGLANAVGYFRATLAATFSGISCESVVALPATINCTTYSEVVAYLTARGNTDKTAVPLYKKSAPGNSAFIIGHWQWSNDAVPVIVPVGPIRFDLVTDGGWGQVLSVDGPTTLTLAAGYTLGLVGNIRLWNTVAATEYAGGGAFTRALAVVTVPSTAGMVAGDQVFATGLSEFSIGNSTRDLQPLANSTARFNAGGLSLVGRVDMAIIPTFNVHTMLKAGIATRVAFVSENDHVTVGWRLGAASLTGGIARHAAGTTRAAREAASVWTIGAVVVAAEAFIRSGMFQNASSISASFYAHPELGAATTALPIVPAGYAGAVVHLRSNLGAVFSGLSCEASPRISMPAYHTSYDEVVAFLTLQGNTYKQAVPLYKKLYAGDSTKIIGHWQWSNDAVPVIIPVGAVDFTKVTASQYGVVSAVDVDGVHITVTAGHTLPASFSARIWYTAAAVEGYNAVAATCVGNIITLASNVGINIGDQVYAIGVSEFTIGGALRNIQPGVEMAQRFTAAGLVSSATAKANSSLAVIWPFCGGKITHAAGQLTIGVAAGDCFIFGGLGPATKSFSGYGADGGGTNRLMVRRTVAGVDADNYAASSIVPALQTGVVADVSLFPNGLLAYGMAFSLPAGSYAPVVVCTVAGLVPGTLEVTNARCAIATLSNDR